jgi:hypothetical protein
MAGSHLSPTLSVKERGQYKYSVENALLTVGSRPPPQPSPCQGEGVNSAFWTALTAR